MARKLPRCQICGLEVIHEQGIKISGRYYHEKNCHDKYIEMKNIKKNKKYNERKVKCGSCLEIDERHLMTKNDKGNYFHIGECYEKHLEHRKFVDEENKKLDALYTHIKLLHGIPDEQFKEAMKSVMWRIQELRNGNDILKGKSEKKYRVGVEYDLLLSAYRLKDDDIKWFIPNVLNNGMEAKDINACLTIALKGLSEAWRLRQAEDKREIDKKKSLAITQDDIGRSVEDIRMNHDKKKDEMDITGLF